MLAEKIEPDGEYFRKHWKRGWVIYESSRVEKALGHIFCASFGVPPDNKKMGVFSSLGSNQKLEFLKSISQLESDEKNRISNLFAIRNKFAHEERVNDFHDLVRYHKEMLNSIFEVDLDDQDAHVIVERKYGELVQFATSKLESIAREGFNKLSNEISSSVKADVLDKLICLIEGGEILGTTESTDEYAKRIIELAQSKL